MYSSFGFEGDRRRHRDRARAERVEEPGLAAKVVHGPRGYRGRQPNDEAALGRLVIAQRHHQGFVGPAGTSAG